MQTIGISVTNAPSPKWGKAGMGAGGDYLGSTSYFSNYAGLPYQNISDPPFGESLLEEKASSYSTPYKFNAKELDDESPQTGRWANVRTI